MYEGVPKEVELPHTEDRTLGFDSQRVLEEIRSAKRNELSPPRLDRWRTWKKKYGRGIMAAIATFIVQREGVVSDEQEWGLEVMPHEVAAEEIEMGVRARLEQSFLNRFNGKGIVIEDSRDDLGYKDYAKIFAQLGPQLQSKILESLSKIEIRSASAQERSIAHMPFKNEERAKKSVAAGWVEGFGTKNKKIVLFFESRQELSAYEEKEVFLHELGHLFDPENPGMQSSVQWAGVRENSGKDISSYPASLREGVHKNREDFAESFTAIMNMSFSSGRRFASEFYPDRYEGMVLHLRQVLGNPEWNPPERNDLPPSLKGGPIIANDEY